MTKIKLQHTWSAVIGFWRMGATKFEISEVMEITPHEVDEIINDYKRLHK